MVVDLEFQRARRSEQMSRRRDTVLEAARTLLAEKPLREITLTAVAERAGIAASGVLRYFDSREAVFSEILGADMDAWLDDLDHELTALDTAENDVEQFAAVAAAHLVRRPSLCELLAASAAILEHNIGYDSALAFKQRNLAQIRRLVDILTAHVEGVSPAAAVHFATTAAHIVSGSWAHVSPAAAVAKAIRDLGYPSVADDYERYLTEAFANQLIGAMVRAADSPKSG